MRYQYPRPPSLLARIIGTLIFLAILIVSFFLFIYVAVALVLFGVVLFSIAWVRHRLRGKHANTHYSQAANNEHWQQQSQQQQPGRIIEGEYEKKPTDD